MKAPLFPMMWSYKAIIVLKTVKFCQSFVDCKLCQNKTISEICKWLILRNHNPWIHKSYYLNTGHKFNIHKTFRRRPISIPLKKPENFLLSDFFMGYKNGTSSRSSSTFNLHIISREYCFTKFTDTRIPENWRFFHSG